MLKRFNVDFPKFPDCQRRYEVLQDVESLSSTATVIEWWQNLLHERCLITYTDP